MTPTNEITIAHQNHASILSMAFSLKPDVRRELMPTRSGLVTLSCELAGEMRLSQVTMTQQ